VKLFDLDTCKGCSSQAKALWHSTLFTGELKKGLPVSRTNSVGG